jgi:hypothetical protein
VSAGASLSQLKDQAEPHAPEPLPPTIEQGRVSRTTAGVRLLGTERRTAMGKPSRREQLRAFYAQQTKPATEAIRRRLRDQQDRERRLIKGMEAFVDLGTVVIDRDQVH